MAPTPRLHRRLHRRRSLRLAEAADREGRLDDCINVVFDATVVTDGPGVHQLSDPRVRHLDPQQATFEAMLVGWATQQRARQLKASTVRSRAYLV